MKLAVVLMTLILPASLLAHDADYGKIVCVSEDPVTDDLGNKIAVLTQTGEAREKLDEDGNREATEIPYRLTVFEGTDVTSDFSVKGLVITDDVYFHFEANDKNASVTIYLDAMDESSMNLKLRSGDQIALGMICH